jgi:signal transduction histidine kinase
MVPVRSAAARYGLAATAATAAVAASHAVVPLLGGAFFFFIFPAVLVAAVLAGVGPGLACAAVYAATAAWIFVAPPGSLVELETRTLARLVLLTGSAALVAIVGGRLRSALDQERRLRGRLEGENAAAQAARVRAETAEDAARRAAALQDQVLAVVGHDLRTPLSAIIMAVQVAQRHAAGDAAIASNLARIARSAWRMNEIIRDLLDAARARQGLGMTLASRHASAYEICAQAIAELEQVHPGRSIRLSASGDPTLEADASRLLQAISNLVGNALQHGDPDRAVEVHVAGEGGSVAVRVRNAGAPIPPGAIDELFEPFRRGDRAADGNGSLGLGLFIVREIARAHGGTVSVSSDAAGTTFELRLPRTPVAPAASAAAPG